MYWCQIVRLHYRARVKKPLTEPLSPAINVISNCKMRRTPSAPSLRSDSGQEDLIENDVDDDQASSIFMADAASSGNASDLEKESTSTEFDHERNQAVMTEETSLLSPTHRLSTTYGGTASIEAPQSKDTMISGNSLPSVVYASPAKPYLPSPSAS